MEKGLRRRITELITFLHRINTSSLSESTDDLLINKCSNTTEITKNQINEQTAFCQMELLTGQRLIVDGVQELLEEEGFLIEEDRKRWYSQDSYFIRTEKGLITFR